MSRWLQNVGNFLEQLDDKAETVVTEQIIANNNNEDEDAADDNLDDILAKRGLGSGDDLSHDDDMEEEIEKNEGEAAADGDEEGKVEDQEGADDKDYENLNNNIDGWDDSQLMNIDVNTADPGSSTADETEPVVDPAKDSTPDETMAEKEKQQQANDDDSKPEQTERELPPGTSDSTSKMEKKEDTTAKTSSLTTHSKEVENPVDQPNPINEGTKAESEAKPPPTSDESLNDGSDNGPKTDDSSGGEQKGKATNSSNHPAAPANSTPKSINSTNVKTINRPKPSPSKAKKPVASTGAPPPPSSKSLKTATAEAKEAQKETRTLRRHVVSLNSQLEAAEAELKAQRKELEVAAERMERGRKKLKQDKESFQKSHAQELTNLKTQHQQILKEQQTKFEEQIASYKSNLAQVEDRRKLEGGNMNKELAQLEEREHEMMTKITMLEDEKSTLLSQITTLQGQQSVLGSRLESLTQASDNAMAREREAEDRLDSVLTQHARQISQRQAREAELETTVSNLNAALVVAKSTSQGKAVVDDKGTTTPKSDNSLLAKIEALEQDLETANSHLTLERERSGALHQQLREMSRETTQEASAVHVKEVHYERQIADMSLTISKLEATLREAQNGVDSIVVRSESDHALEDSNAGQVAALSEEVVRLRDKLANYSSESKAMKSRLQSAINRANKAEDELAMERVHGNGSAPSSMELGLSVNGLDRRRKRGTTQTGTIRSVMNLDSPGESGGRREQLGNVVDAVDSFAVTTGKYMRRNPLARAGFIFYLLLIHLWTFVLLFIHAHNFEEHSDFGAVTPHGPHALVQNSPQDLVAKTTDAGSPP